MDFALVLTGLIVGVVVGLTGMGGGALMTPILVLFFNVPPLAAVSSDLVASFFMKPIGGLVHLRRGTVNLELVKWLCLGSVPAAFCGVFLLRLMGDAEQVQHVVKISLGVALIVAAGSLMVKAYLTMVSRARRRAAGLPSDDTSTGAPVVHVKPARTVLIGALGGLIVGMTSVGSGSLIIICLLALYPALSAGRLVGTDLVQAVPLVGAAALAHIMYGDFQLDLAASLIVGAIPGVWLGARMSSQAPGGVIRRALSLVLIASGLKLIGVSTAALSWLLLAVVVVGPLAWAVVRRQHGLPPFGYQPLRSLAGLGRKQAAVSAAEGAAGAPAPARTDRVDIS